MTDRHASVTQAEFGALVGISQRAVSELIERGVLARDASCEQWLLAYCVHLRAVGAGRSGDELSRQRARAARATADRTELELARMRRGLAPTGALEQALTAVSSGLAAHLAELRTRIGPLLPGVPQAAIDLITKRLDDCIAYCAAARLSDSDVLLREDDDDGDEEDAQA